MLVDGDTIFPTEGLATLQLTLATHTLKNRWSGFGLLQRSTANGIDLAQYVAATPVAVQPAPLFGGGGSCGREGDAVAGSW